MMRITAPISVSGRSLTADLIDCSASEVPGCHFGVKLEGIGAKLAKPYCVPVRAEVRSGESRGEGLVRLSLQQPADVPPGHTQIKPALFDFDAIRRNMRPREVVVLDAQCDVPALSESPDAPN